MDPKKKIMFILEEDYFFYLYNVLIILYSLKCWNEKTQFMDIQKLGILTEVLNNDSLCATYLSHEELDGDLIDLNRMLESYARVKINNAHIGKMLYSLSGKGLLKISKGGKYNTLNCYIENKDVVKDLISSVFFEQDLEKMKRLKTRSKLRTVSYVRLENKVFDRIEG